MPGRQSHGRCRHADTADTTAGTVDLETTAAAVETKTTAAPGATAGAGSAIGAVAGGSSDADAVGGDDGDGDGDGGTGAWVHVVITLAVVGCVACAVAAVRWFQGRQAGQTDGFNMSFANAAYVGASPANDNGELHGTNADQATYAEFPETPAEPPAEASHVEPTVGKERLGTISNVSARVQVWRTHTAVCCEGGRQGAGARVGEWRHMWRGSKCVPVLGPIVAGAVGNNRTKTRCGNHP